MRIAVNALVLYAAWFAAVWSAAANHPFMASAASICAIAINLTVSFEKSADLKLIALAAVVGLVGDGALVSLGITRYASPGTIHYLPPPWIVLMWMAFATTLNMSLAWLQHRLAVAAFLGAIAGPLSYYAGARLGGMHFSEPLWRSLAAVGMMWTFAFPLLLHFARQDRG